MRKSLGLIALAIVVLMTMVSLFIGCSNEIDGSLTGSLTVRTSSANARTISPPSAEIGIVSYRINGVFSDTITTFPEVTFSGSQITLDNLLVGKWTITLDGLNEDGLVIATKTQIVTIRARQNTTATFYLDLFSGTGTVSISVLWPDTVTSFTQVRGTITPTVTGKEGFIVAASSADTTTEGFLTITQTINDFPTGSFQFKLEFLDESSNPVGLYYREALNVYKDMTSSKTYEVPEAVLPIETPVISIDDAFQVSISCATSEVTLYYTTDGNEPTSGSNVYSAPFTILENTTIKALAVREDRLSSAIAEEDLEVPAAAPTFSHEAKVYDAPQTITISSETAGAIIYYTLNNMDPEDGSELYSQPIEIKENTIIRAWATHPNHSNSAISSAEYKIQAGKPTFSLREGSYSGIQDVILYSATENVIFHYTTDGSTPTTASPVFTSSITLSATATIRAIAVKEGMEASEISQSSYTIYLFEQVPAPTFTPLGETYEGPQSISIETETEGATIYYTLNGDEPDKSSSQYSVPISISENTTIKAYAVKEGTPDSVTTSRTYLIKPFTPTFSVAAGTYMESKSVGIESITEGTTIYYTRDGIAPTRESLRYTSPFTISSTTTVKAIAVKDNMADSDMASSEYVIAGYSGIKAVNPAKYTVSIDLPAGWDSGTVVTGAFGTVTAVVTPEPAVGELTYSWYLDGMEMKNNAGTTTFTTGMFEFGRSPDEVWLESGPHILSVEVTAGSMIFSDQKVIVAASTGTIGEVDFFEVGDIGPSGGYIFYENPNHASDDWRYLEAAPEGWSGTSTDPTYVFGYNRTTSDGTNVAVGTSTGLGTGKANTIALVQKMGTTAYSSSSGTTKAMYAAKACADYSIVVGTVTYDDWFLPSKDELNQMYLNLKKNSLGGFSDTFYWSSSEDYTSDAWGENFNNGSQNFYYRYFNDRVRPVRAFL